MIREPGLFAGTPHTNSPVGWWTEYGGALDPVTGAVHLPRVPAPPKCPFPCGICDRRDGPER